MPRWGISDDKKLISLWRTPTSGVDHTKIDQASVKAVHQRHFQTFNYKNFAPLYRSKARSFAVSLTLDGHRKRSATSKSKSIAQGVALDSISDDEEDAYSNEDQYDIDLEIDSEEEESEEEDSSKQDKDESEEEEEGNIMPPKKATPKKAKGQKYALGGDDAVENISHNIRDMQINKVPMFSMDYVLPFMICTYNEKLDQMATVEVLVPMLPKEFFLVDIISGGTKVVISIQVPSFFVDEDRVYVANEDVDGFNEDTYQAQAFKDRCENINTIFGMKNAIYGNPMSIDMPFICEERIVEWEIQGHVNTLGKLTNDLGSTQFHAILSVTVRKLPTKRKTTGGFRVVVAGGNENEAGAPQAMVNN